MLYTNPSGTTQYNYVHAESIILGYDSDKLRSKPLIHNKTQTLQFLQKSRQT